ncbi:P2RX4-like protein [Mya arenaria]|uniref:P2RX4-like protein n=1 Tax=Mya arenaria TaxID=6604 RepID=A0ABY7E1R9_MYAAR|nr:P2RX4-like protein [Mya arenaria]
MDPRKHRYAIIFQKGYQEFDNVQGAITTKLKGVAETKNVFSSNSSRIWDVNDYVVPPQENLAFFVTTNLIVTDGQQMGVPNPPALAIAEKFTVFIKNNIEFPKFGVKRRNIPSNRDVSALANCRYDPNTDTQCPIFQLKTIVSGADIESFNAIAVKVPTHLGYKRLYRGNKEILCIRRNIVGFDDQNELRNCRFKLEDDKYKFCPIFVLGDIATYAGTQFVNIAQKGGVIQILISWNCNLDHGAENCLPEYSFRRLDEENDVLSPGYNFRFSRYYKDENGTDTRTLFKAYGIKFILTLQGRAGKFSIVPLVLNIGSGLALLSVATIICDIVVLYVLKSRALYKEKKYLEVVGDDAYEEMRDDSRAG